jgi:hypothetical protein
MYNLIKKILRKIENQEWGALNGFRISLQEWYTKWPILGSFVSKKSNAKASGNC